MPAAPPRLARGIRSRPIQPYSAAERLQVAEVAQIAASPVTLNRSGVWHPPAGGVQSDLAAFAFSFTASIWAFALSLHAC